MRAKAGALVLRVVVVESLGDLTLIDLTNYARNSTLELSP